MQQPVFLSCTQVPARVRSHPGTCNQQLLPPSYPVQGMPAMTHNKLSVLVSWCLAVLHDCSWQACGDRRKTLRHPPHFLPHTPPRLACCHKMVSHAYWSLVFAGLWSLQAAHAGECASALQQHNIGALIAADMGSCRGQCRAARDCPTHNWPPKSIVRSYYRPTSLSKSHALALMMVSQLAMIRGGSLRITSGPSLPRVLPDPLTLPPPRAPCLLTQPLLAGLKPMPANVIPLACRL